MRKKLLIVFSVLGLLIIVSGQALADDADGHMGDGDMMGGDWLGIPFMGFWMLGLWLVLVVIAFLVYKDAQDRGMNGILWFILVVLPWVGILFLIIYLIVRESKGTSAVPQKSANAILDERYARGEVTRDDYIRMKKDFKGEE
jgi:putative membrane protein